MKISFPTAELVFEIYVFFVAVGIIVSGIVAAYYKNKATFETDPSTVESYREWYIMSFGILLGLIASVFFGWLVYYLYTTHIQKRKRTKYNIIDNALEFLIYN